VTDDLPEFKPGIYQHYKGPLYQAYELCHHSETEELLVVYRCLYGKYDLWVRPYTMFMETIEYEGKTLPRFNWLRDAENNEL
jgi:hypothetical protein